MFCKHEWKILSDQITESKIEQAIRLGYKLNANNGLGVKLLTEKKLVQIVTCVKCGKLKRFVEDI